MRTGSKRLIFSILSIIIAVVLPAILIVQIGDSFAADHRFLVPGTTTLSVDEPGDYGLWYEYRTIFEGRSYHQPEDLPDGLEISIRATDSGARLPLESGSMRVSSGETASVKIGSVSIAEPTSLTISVTGETERMVFNFAESKVLAILGRVGGAIASAAIFGILGLISGIWGLVDLLRNTQSARPTAAT